MNHQSNFETSKFKREQLDNRNNKEYQFGYWQKADLIAFKKVRVKKSFFPVVFELKLTVIADVFFWKFNSRVNFFCRNQFNITYYLLYTITHGQNTKTVTLSMENVKELFRGMFKEQE